MGLFDVLGKAKDAVMRDYESSQKRIMREASSYERKLSGKSDSELREIVRDESKPYLERAVASNELKNR